MANTRREKSPVTSSERRYTPQRPLGRTTPLKSRLFWKKRTLAKLRTASEASTSTTTATTRTVTEATRIKNGVQEATSPDAETRPVSVYVGANFSVRLCEWFRFERLIRNPSEGGLVLTEYHGLRRLRQMELSAGGRRIMALPNAGGSSEISEILSFEMLRRCFGAQLVKTEMEVEYFPEGGSITDMVIQLFQNHVVGVSVTRAYTHQRAYTIEDATRLLNKKLNGVVQSSRNTLEPWSKQILHVWAPNHHVTNVTAHAYSLLPAHVTGNTLVLVTTAHNAPEIFTNK